MTHSALHLIGGICWVFCGWCVGDSVCMQEQEHQNALQKTIGLLDRIRSEIEFRQSDLTQLIRVLQAEALIGQAEESFQTLTPFPFLTRREKAVFRECMAGLGRAGAQQECQRLALYRSRFEQFQNESQPKLDRTMELAHKLGLAAGLAAAVLLL